MTSPSLRVVYAGDRDIAVWVLQYMLNQGVKPLALMLPSPERASHSRLLLQMCDYLEPEKIFYGKSFTLPESIKRLDALQVDYIICVHFPYIIPPEVLCLPRIGVINLHPAYLPYNRGWHTPSWAILEGTPFGATLHFMDEGLDTGDIIHQKTLEILPYDTADTLYQRVKQLELEVFVEAWDWLLSCAPPRKPQPLSQGTSHRKSDLQRMQEINLDQSVRAGELIDRLRALTTNRIEEACYFIIEGKRYSIQVKIFPDLERDQNETATDVSLPTPPDGERS